jgi:nitrite reductase (NADH) small subunit
VSVQLLYLVGKTSDFEDLKPLYVDIEDLRIGVYRLKGKYYAFANICPHQGGPACEGVVLGNVESSFDEQGKRSDFLSDERYNITCPWHGIEFDLETGICRALRDWRLASFQTIVEGDRVLVRK